MCLLAESLWRRDSAFFTDRAITACMPRLDRYDILGLLMLGLIIALWIAHFVLPTPPPLPELP